MKASITMKCSTKNRVLRKEPLSPRVGFSRPKSACAVRRRSPASNKSNPSAISRTGRGCASPSHISYFISHISALAAPLCALALSACSATKAVESASGKNLNLDGYLMLGDVETTSPETGTPTGKLIIGRVTYKSRKVAIPADQKVPTTGYYKATKTKSLFGTEEEIVEYDFTSESPDNLTPFLESLKGDPK